MKYGRTVTRPGDPAPGDVVFAEKVREDRLRDLGSRCSGSRGPISRTFRPSVDASRQRSPGPVSDASPEVAGSSQGRLMSPAAPAPTRAPDPEASEALSCAPATRAAGTVRGARSATRVPAVRGERARAVSNLLAVRGEPARAVTNLLAGTQLPAVDAPRAEGVNRPDAASTRLRGGSRQTHPATRHTKPGCGVSVQGERLWRCSGPPTVPFWPSPRPGRGCCSGSSSGFP